ncbi:MAG: RagB/SusD family nutrient uptake outer membrane protein [Williamsia sp.]|nr:RagB/SusD family nutrient uptake outer membrane protein [Williamsia sp.]
MKKIIKLLPVCVLLATASCKKEFIQLSPESTVSIDVLFKTDKDFQDAVIGVYSNFRPQYQNFWRFGDLRADDTKFGLVSQLEDIRNDNFTSDNSDPVLASTWRNYYSIISRANKVLNNIENAPASVVTNKDRHKGEAEFLRALAYFDLVRIFGDVPLITKDLTIAEAYKTPREKAANVYNNVIIKDLLDAETKLPQKYTGADIGRATKGAAKALLGKVYLTLKDFAKAETKLQEVTQLGYALLPVFNDLWDYTKDEHHSEYVFDIEYEEGQGNLGSNFISQFALDFQAGGGPLVAELARRYNIPSGTGGATGIPNQTIFDLFSLNPADKRKDTTATKGLYGPTGVFIPISATGVSALSLKYMVKLAGAATDSKVNWKVIRYADVLLMYAEALNENGKTDQALTYLNMVRTRAGIPSYSGLSKDDARERIYQERRLELHLEGQRWFDLVRTGRALTVMAPYGMKPYMTVFPIPQAQIEIVNDPAVLPQNQGYN